MSKNMTRKGLAFGSAFALASAALVAPAAYAVDDITLEAFYGQASDLATVQGADLGLVLNTTIQNIGSASAADLKYLVEMVSDYAISDITTGLTASTLYSAHVSAANAFDNNDVLQVNDPAGSARKVVLQPLSMDETYADQILSVASTASGGSATVANPGVLTFTAPNHKVEVGDQVKLTNWEVGAGPAKDITDGNYPVTAVTVNTFSVTTTINTSTAGSTALIATSGAAGTVHLGSRPLAGQNNLLYLEVPAQNLDGDATTYDNLTIKVTAFIDSNDDNIMGSGEWKSASRDVTFVHPNNLTFSGGFDYFADGSTSVTGAASVSNINNGNLQQVLTEQLSESVNVGLDSDQTDPADAPQTATSVSYDALNDEFDFTFATAKLEALNGTVVGGTTKAGIKYTSQLTINSLPVSLKDGAGTAYFDDNVRDSSFSSTIKSEAVNNIVLGVATGSTVSQDTPLVGGDGKIVALEGTKSMSFTVQAWTDSAKTVAAGSGHSVSVTLTDTANGLGTTTLTAGGKTLPPTGVINSITFVGLTDINGRYSFTVEADKAVDGEKFSVTVNAAGQSDTSTVEWDKAQVQLTTYPTDANGGTLQVAPGGSVTVDMRVSDQFGNVPAGTHQVAVTRAPIAGTTAQRDELAEYANWSYVVPVSAEGRASVTITDNGSATLEGSDRVTMQVQTAAIAGGGYVNATGSSSKSFTLAYENDLKTAALAAKANNNGVLKGTVSVKPIALETKSLVNWDSRIDLASARPEYAATNTFSSLTAASANDDLVAISGTVKTAAGVGISNVPVTISGTGLVFADAKAVASANWFIKDSVTVNSVSGDFIVYVRGAVSGKRTVNITAGALTTSVDLTFAAGSVAATKMELTVPATSDVNRSVDVVAKVTDDNGNPAEGVTVTFKEAGAGYLNTTSAVTDASGEARVNLITLAGDTGTSTITATATLKGVPTSVSKSLTIGAAASTEGKVNVGSFNGKLVVYALGLDGARITWKVGGNWGQDFAVGDTLNRFDRPTPLAGVTVTVDIYVDGVKRLTKSVVTR